jgi:UDP-2-acetamido-2-deoxy-ribo-hexuluronate aminotransferase
MYRPIAGQQQVLFMQFTGLKQQYQHLQSRIEHSIKRVLEHGQYIMGPEVKLLESSLQAFCGAKHAVTVANGTDALQIALMVGGIGTGDSVLVPSFTYTATAEAILVLGARPIFTDVSPVTFNVDLACLKRDHDLAVKHGHRPKALIAVDLFGLPADWPALNRFAAEHDLFLIADSAQSFGAVDAAGQKVGRLAPITTTSFFPAKPLGCYGDGGAIFTDDDHIADVVRSIRVHGQGQQKYETIRVGMNSRLDTMQAAILLAKLEVFEYEIARRNELASIYSSNLPDTLVVPRKPDGVISAWAQYTVRSRQRDMLQAKLKDRGVATAIYYPKPMHAQSAYARHLLPSQELSVSDHLCEEVISLPMNPYFTLQEAEAICDHVTESV